MSHPLLTAPIGRSLLRLAGPTTGIMLVQILVGLTEALLVARLGTDALAGFALVFPFMALTFNVAVGGMGGGVAAGLARALGGARRQDARALVLHALVLAAGLGLVLAGLAWILAPRLYAFMGGSGRALEDALLFSNIWFSAVVTVWLHGFLAALLRGAGDAATPARYGLVVALLYVPLAIVLTLGIGAWPGLGLAGVALASVSATSFSVLLLARAVLRGRLGFAPTFAGMRLQARLFGEILKVGLPACFSSVTAVLSAALVIGLVGRFGVAALAGYGIATRLESMLGPIAFGIGSGLTTLVGIAAGAGAWPRARRAAWTGALSAGTILGVLGWIAALLPETWSRLFTAQADVIAASVACISFVAPVFCLLGLGLGLSFASQGAGRMATPLVASAVRMLIAAGGGFLALEWMELGLDGVFIAVAAGMAAYGLVIGGALLLAPWGSRRCA